MSSKVMLSSGQALRLSGFVEVKEGPVLTVVGGAAMGAAAVVGGRISSVTSSSESSVD